jgi:Fic-DOC domain mobile mystery protein B
MVSSVGLKGSHAPGATPLNDEDLEGLLPEHITTQAQLNEWEENNIVKATVWRRGRVTEDPLDESFFYELHRRMFDDTWAWAGKTRLRELNLGVDPAQIRPQIRNTLLNTREQLIHAPQHIDQIAARLHHQVVKTHAFRNGNGRHARIVADAVLVFCKSPAFSWGHHSLTKPGATRTMYIDALRKADCGDPIALYTFVRS